MQYKQLLLSAAISLTAISVTQAQYRRNAGDDYEQRFYIKIGAQYAMPIMGYIGFKGRAEATPNLSGIDSFNQKSSFGEGLWAVANVGYFITPNFGIEGGVQVGVTKPEAIFERTSGSFYKNVAKTSPERSILLNPSIVYRVPFNRLCIIGKTGVIIPLNTTLKQNINAYQGGATYEESEYELRTRFELGFSCALGAEYRLTEHIALSLDLNVMALKVDAKEQELISEKIRGMEVIDQIPDDKKTIYYDNDVIQPTYYLRRTPMPISFSNASARLGIAIYF